MADILNLLQSSRLFAGVPVGPLQKLAASSQLRFVEKSSFVFRQDEQAAYFYFLMTGRVRLIQHTISGKDVTMAVFAPGELIGVVVSLTGEDYPGTAEALEDCDVIALPGAQMWELMNAYGPLAVRVLRMVADRLHEAHNHIRELSVERVQQRIARSTLRLAQKVGVTESDGTIRLDLSLSRQDLAQMSGTTLETVSRTLTTWEQTGVVNAGREHLTILKSDELTMIAEGFASAI